MDDSTLRYYEAEMRYLRDAAREFAQLYPDRAAMLNLDRVGDRDPYVERLFEGFAFITGRLREKIDDDLPEMTEGLVSLLWPHYLRTIPSAAIEEIAPDYRLLKEVEVLPAGFLVESQPVGTKQTRCLYRTTRELTLYPLHLSAASRHHEPDGRSIIRLRFDCGPLAEWDKISLARLPLWFNADAPLACALHMALTKQRQHLWLRLPGEERRELSEAYFSPQGFAADDTLWPKGETAFSGYQLLLEYFTFREKFMGVILHGLEKLSLPAGTPWFELEIVLSELWSHDLPFSADNIRLHCVPVINLFNLEADPLQLCEYQNEYLLRPMRLQDGHTEIYSVDEVSSAARGGKEVLAPFSSFRHRGGMLRHNAPERYYHTRVKLGPSGMHDTWLILGGDAFEAREDDKKESLSLKMTGTNGQLPRKALRSTLLDRTVSSTTAPVQVRNLCAPTLPCYPPTTDRFHWRVLSHLGSNFLSMMDNPEVLRGTLALYDWTDNEMNRRRLEAIVEVKHHLLERFDRGRLLRGVGIDITLNSDGFSGEGDICLFGEMLHRFFALYADIHLFNRLTLILQPSGKCYQWNENHSQRIPG